MKYEIIKSSKYLARDSSGSLFAYSLKPEKIAYVNNEGLWSSWGSTHVTFIKEINNALDFIVWEDKDPWEITVLEDYPNYTVILLSNGLRSFTITKTGLLVEIEEQEPEVVDLLEEDIEKLDSIEELDNKEATNLLVKLFGAFLVIPNLIFKRRYKDVDQKKDEKKEE